MIFDQFEQFFVYTDDEARRKDFIHDLASCYNDNELADKVKILVSIREDWFARMDEIQEVLNYTHRNFPQAFKLANQIKYSFDRAYALSTIAEAYSKLNQPDKAAELFQDAIASANQIEYSPDRANALRTIAEAYSKLNQPETARELLQDVLTPANQIEDSFDRAYALITIAEAAANLKNWGQALKAVQQCPSDDCEVESLAEILTIYAEQRHLELKKAEDKNN